MKHRIFRRKAWILGRVLGLVPALILRTAAAITDDEAAAALRLGATVV